MNQPNIHIIDWSQVKWNVRVLSSSVTFTHMVLEVNYGQVLGGSAGDSADFAEVAEVLLDHILLVEGRGHVLALDDREVSGGQATEAV